MYTVFFFKNEGRKREICFAVQKNCHTAVALHILLKWKHFYINVQKKTQAHEGQGHAVFIQLNTKNKTKIQVSSSKLGTTSIIIRTSLVAQTVKCLSTMRETWVRALGWEDPLEKEMAIHSSSIAWKIPWTEEPGRLQSMGRKESDTTE